MVFHGQQSFISGIVQAPKWMKFAAVATVGLVIFFLTDIPAVSFDDSYNAYQSYLDRLDRADGPPTGTATAESFSRLHIAPKAKPTPTPLTAAAGYVPGAAASGAYAQPAFKAEEQERTLISYVYAESAQSRENLQFFLKHGVHENADFVFIFNGETDAELTIPKKKNFRVVKRGNTCYDLGSHAEVLTKNNMYLKYKNFILMNASVRGPFMPRWTSDCWSERFNSLVTDEVKLVGISINCWPTPHVQSMVWATDREGMTLLLFPPKESPRHDVWMDELFQHPESFQRPPDYQPASPDWVEHGLNQCFGDRQQAVEAEIAATGIILGAGKRVEVLLMKFQSTWDYLEHCSRLGQWDPNAADNNYDGVRVHPFETMFVKTNRGIGQRMLDLQTEWSDSSNYTSYDYC